MVMERFTNLILMGCLHDPANVQQTSSKSIQNTRAGRLLDRVNTLLHTARVVVLGLCWTWLAGSGRKLYFADGYLHLFYPPMLKFLQQGSAIRS